MQEGLHVLTHIILLAAQFSFLTITPTCSLPKARSLQMSQLKIKTATMPDSLSDMPIDPEWIHEGNPTATGTIVAQSADKKVSSGYWHCTEGKFEWTFGWDEFAHIFEGEVTISEEDGESYTLRAGDTVNFPLGLKTNWHITQPVKKFFVLRTADALEL
jgi:uncharacterized cupin superfamily protein